MSGWDAFAKYVGIQGVMALATTATVIVMALVGRLVPPELWSLQGIAWGFYFAKNGYAIANIGRKPND